MTEIISERDILTFIRNKYNSSFNAYQVEFSHP